MTPAGPRAGPPGRGEGYSPPLQVVALIATRPGETERGPLVRMRSEDAQKRLLTDGEMVRVQMPRRQQIATLEVDDALPRGSVVLRDIVGAAPSEIVQVVKVNLDTTQRGFLA